jgi:hypothetical protein
VTLTDLESKIQILVNKNQKCRADKDCVAKELGEKSCGGPDSYVHFSTLDPESTKISPLIKQHLKLKKQDLANEITFSDCSFIESPKLECNEKKVCSVVAR